METDAGGLVKAITLVAILAISSLVGWRIGAPESFNSTLASVGFGQDAAAPAAVAATAPAPAPSGESAGH